ncbi:zinc finger protein 236 [Bactrocera dorsalis]|uniref:Zinc finger protein 236 n=1 Tax=Bactrocera dorsalis TaxID=27457 RepID=A0A9B2LCS7_BACDO|nr:zinc finger protein 236 [Bactrocera dorsalis]
MSNASASSTYNGHNDFANPRLEKHMTFVCPECGVEFESQQDWRRHLNEEHDYINKTPEDFDFKEISESFHECQVCHKWVANANQAIALLQYHRFLHLPFNRTYRCRHCKGGFTRKRALCEHLYRFHSRQIIMADKMRNVEGETTTSTNFTQTAEQKMVRDPRLNAEFYLRFICPHCGKVIEKFEQWLKHLDIHPSTSEDLRMHRISGSRNHYCLQCRKLLYTNEQSKLQRHRFTHLPFRLYFKCAFCMVKKSFKSEIFRHFVYAHPRHFNEAKPYIKKPIEWGAKINDRLNTELDAILRRYKCTNSYEQGDTSGENSRGRPVKKQTYASEKARLAAQKQTSASSTTGTLRRSNIRIIKDFDMVQQKSGTTPTESVTEDDFEELCADVFESIEDELNSTIINKKNESKELVKNENTKQQNQPDEELVISIEIDAIDDNNELTEHKQNFMSTPPRKRLKLSEAEISTRITNEQITKENNTKITKKSPAVDVNKKAMFEENIIYLCPECGNEFDIQASWRTHVFKEHNIENAIQTNFQLLENKQSYLCLDCMDVQHTTQFAELQRHRFTHMPFQAYLKCKLCSKTKSSKPKMLHHFQQCHGSQKKSVQNKTAPNNSEGTLHFHPCTICLKYFTTKERLQLHQTQACGVRSNGLRTAMCGNNTNISSTIANNMKLLIHLKQARVRMKHLITRDKN